jgi:hypothetical protein
MSRVQASLIALLLVAVVVVPLSVAAPGVVRPVDGATSGEPAPGAVDERAMNPVLGSSADPPEEKLVEADSLTFRIRVHANGSARWSLVYTRSLDNDTERSRFRSFARRFNENETQAYQDFKKQAGGLVETGRDRTGREMTATDFSKQAKVGGSCTIPKNCGTIRMSFTWTAFARQDGEKVVIDDVFAGQGLYLGRDKSVVFTRGTDLVFADVSPDPDSKSNPDSLRESDSITWQGERDFADSRPRVVYVPADSDVTVTPADSPTTTAGGSPASSDSPTSAGPGVAPPNASDTMPMLLVGGLLVVLLGVGFAFVRRRGDGGPSAAPGGGGGADGGAAANAVTAESAVPDEELLTDEDKVVNMLQDNGGRMKQVDIVDESGWSKSKVSMLLSDMEEEGDISKLRVGRENIVSLAGHEPEAAGSPHEDVE